MTVAILSSAITAKAQYYQIADALPPLISPALSGFMTALWVTVRSFSLTVNRTAYTCQFIKSASSRQFRHNLSTDYIRQQLFMVRQNAYP